MKVTACKQQIKHTERVSVFIDGKYAFSLMLDQLLEARLKVGQDIDEPEIAKLKKWSQDGKLRAKAMNWVFLRPRSVKELRDYLKRTTYRSKTSSEKGEVSEEAAQMIIEEFTRRLWVDDLQFAQWWVGRSSRKSKSRSFLRSELQSKGIDRQVVNELLVERNEMDTLKELVGTLSKKPKYQERDRLLRYLIGKGFSYSSITEALADGSAEKDGC